MKRLYVRDIMDAEQAATNGVELDQLLETTWPEAVLDRKEQSFMSKPENALRRCYENDTPYDPQSLVTTITLETPLATGNREERPAQVWRATASGDSTQLVARIYDPVYFNTSVYDRFVLTERAVTSEKEAYRRLQRYQGSLVPTFRDVLVAEIPADPPRHIYVILLEYMPGIDLQARMRTVGATTCSRHKAGIFNAVARASFPLYRAGVYLDDLMDRNVILREPQEPSQEDFCVAENCPFMHTLHIDLSNSPLDDHAYAPQLCIIDLENVRFHAEYYDLADCRALIRHEWKIYCEWLSPKDIDTAFVATA
ncbi:hypothetical protein C8R46DRAFT_1341931 [Mycena filopes]|nr:hypothetical protein C8R46DRAFT_1341931 [Mycena filopes]